MTAINLHLQSAEDFTAASRFLGDLAKHAPSAERINGAMLNSAGMQQGLVYPTTDESAFAHTEARSPAIVVTPDSPEFAQAKAAAEHAAAPKRERGKPAPGRARRTKEEIAEDEAAEKAEAELREAGEDTGAVVPDRQISTSPEDRGEADDAGDDSPEDAAQDDADEAAESTEAEITHDTVRDALGQYAKAFGMSAAMEDGPKVLAMVCGDGVDKISAIPDDKLAAVHAGIVEMTEKNPFKREAA